MERRLDIPAGAAFILDTLGRAGREAHVVGGCVRDSLLGRPPQDWDICTSARPEEVLSAFPGRAFGTGLQHGTVTVALDGERYEVTTFRVDGAYLDHRRPDRVEFVSRLEEDLARRDFTMNAMAYSPGRGLTDPFGGANDLAHGVIRCVGAADRRFREDALRLMRALRFAAVYGFSIEADTAAALHRNAPLLGEIAPERVAEELRRLLPGDGVLEVLLGFGDVLAVPIPELKPCIGFEQHNHYHVYTVYEHMARAVALCESRDVTTRLALLLHDIGKPACYTFDGHEGHFYGHGPLGRDLAGRVLTRLRFDNRTKSEVKDLVLYHDADIPPTLRAVRRWLNRLGEEQFFRLLDVHRADILAHAQASQRARAAECDRLRAAAEAVLAEKQCFSLKDLAVNGRDAMAAGIPAGPAVGCSLRAALDRVIAGELPNDRASLLDFLNTFSDKKPASE